MNFSYSKQNLDRNPWVIYHEHQYMKNAIFSFSSLRFSRFLVWEVENQMR